MLRRESQLERGHQRPPLRNDPTSRYGARAASELSNKYAPRSLTVLRIGLSWLYRVAPGIRAVRLAILAT
jgi:hypothetical protein